MAARRKTATKIYDLRIELKEIEPLIWRRVLVPGNITLPNLHDLLQLVMGWTNSHLHSFEVSERTFGMDGTDLEELKMLNEKRFTLGEVLGDSIRELIYEYDFGDSWRHQITVTPITKPRSDWSYPLCVAGAGAAPPEDVGGVRGYEEFLSAINDPKHEEHNRMLEWIGGAFDPAGFDLNEINRTLRIGPRPYGKTDSDC